MDLANLFLSIVHKLRNINGEIAYRAITRQHSETLLGSEIKGLLKELRDDGLIETFEQERPYGDMHIHRAKCDFAFTKGAERYWMELIAFPTNYCGGGGSPITNHIDKVKKDLEKVKVVAQRNEIPLVLMIAYPFSGEEQWNTHLSRLRGTGFTWKTDRITLPVQVILSQLDESRKGLEPLFKNWKKYKEAYCYVYLFHLSSGV